MLLLQIFGLLLLFIPLAFWSKPASSSFTAEERQWLAQHSTLSICYASDFPPNLFLNKQRQPADYIPELYALLGKKLGIDFKLEITSWLEAVSKATQRECVGLALVRNLEQWKKDFILSDELFDTYSYLYVRRDHSANVKSMVDLKKTRLLTQRNCLGNIDPSKPGDSFRNHANRCRQKI